jgi:hypothetical protein
MVEFDCIAEHAVLERLFAEHRRGAAIFPEHAGSFVCGHTHTQRDERPAAQLARTSDHEAVLKHADRFRGVLDRVCVQLEAAEAHRDGTLIRQRVMVLVCHGVIQGEFRRSEGMAFGEEADAALGTVGTSLLSLRARRRGRCDLDHWCPIGPAKANNCSAGSADRGTRLFKPTGAATASCL